MGDRPGHNASATKNIADEGSSPDNRTRVGHTVQGPNTDTISSRIGKFALLHRRTYMVRSVSSGDFSNPGLNRVDMPASGVPHLIACTGAISLIRDDIRPRCFCPWRCLIWCAIFGGCQRQHRPLHLRLFTQA